MLLGPLRRPFENRPEVAVQRRGHLPALRAGRERDLLDEGMGAACVFVKAPCDPSCAFRAPIRPNFASQTLPRLF